MEKGQDIYDHYHDPISHFFLDLPSNITEKIDKYFQDKSGGRDKKQLETIFDEASQEVYKVMENESFARFAKSEDFNSLNLGNVAQV